MNRRTPAADAAAHSSLLVLRVTIAALLAAHGWMRWLGGGVVPFGDWLTSQGVPGGFLVAAAVTVIEVAGTPLLAWGRCVVPLCLTYSAIYLVGLVLVHLPAGWFVVGAGRNGMEYSVLLIACLLLLARHAWAQRRGFR